MDWKELYNDRKTRPGINELKTYFSAQVFAIFTQFSDTLSKTYNVGCAPATFSAKHGWTFRFGRNNLYLLSGVYVENGAFYVGDIAVNCTENLAQALAYVDESYANFKTNYDEIVARKISRQGERTKQRLEREKHEIAELSELIVPEKFNRYRWSPKVSRQDLKRLYEADSKGLLDEELVDKIGFTLYARCVQGRDTWQDIEHGRLKCHHCGNMLYSEKLMQCSCGYQYIFRDYMRSFRKENMPSGAATHIFNAFIVDWEKARNYQRKMQLIDNLIHEFHINLTSGVKGRFVGINLIDGTKKQIADLILTLAYGENKGEVIAKFKGNLG